MPVNSIERAKNVVLTFEKEGAQKSDLEKAVMFLTNSPDEVKGDVELALREIVKVKDPKISNVVSAFFGQRSIKALPEDVQAHPAFHPDAMRWSLQSLNKVLGFNRPGREGALSNFQRQYCDSNVKEGFYLIRQSATPDEKVEGFEVKYFSLSMNRGKKVTHTLVNRVQDPEGNISWIIGDNHFRTLTEITEKYCRGLTPAPKPPKRV